MTITFNPMFKNYEETDVGSRTLMILPKDDGLEISIAEWDAFDDDPDAAINREAEAILLHPLPAETSPSDDQKVIWLPADKVRELYEWLHKRFAQEGAQ